MPGFSIAGTTGAVTTKPNLSRVFFHDGAWWMVAFDSLDWFLWKKVSDGNWTKQTGTGALDLRAAARPDCWVDSATNKLYVFFNHSTTSKFFRLTYAAGAWSKDTGATDITVPGTFGASDEEASFTRAADGRLFAFGYQDLNKVRVNWSTDSGATWQAAAVDILTGLAAGSGLTDCMPFAWNGANHVGVVVGENTVAEPSNEKFHFLRLADGADPSVVANWVDETANLPSLGGAGNDADDHVHLKVGSDNQLYAIVKTSAGGVGTDPAIGLYVRDTATPTAGWTLFVVLPNSEANPWTRPALVIDTVNSQLYALGAIESATGWIQYRKAALTALSTLKDQPRVDVIRNTVPPDDDLNEPSVAAANPTVASGALVLAYNLTQALLWEATIAVPAAAAVTLAARVAPASALTPSPRVSAALAALAVATSTVPASLRVPATLAGRIAAAGAPRAALAVGTLEVRLAATLAGLGAPRPALSVEARLAAAAAGVSALPARPTVAPGLAARLAAAGAVQGALAVGAQIRLAAALVAAGRPVAGLRLDVALAGLARGGGTLAGAVQPAARLASALAPAARLVATVSAAAGVAPGLTATLRVLETALATLRVLPTVTATTRVP